MVELQQFQNLIASLLSHDNNERTNAETQINQFSQQNPDLFTQYCLNIVQINDQSLQSVKINAIVMLKKNLILGKDKPSLFVSLSQNLRNQFQVQILTILNEMTNQTLINQLSDLISDLASSLYNDKTSSLSQEDKWGNLVNNLFDLYKTGKPAQMQASLRIIDSIIEQTQEKLSFFADQFQELFKAGFANNNLDIQYMTAKCLMTLIIQFKPSLTKNFKPFSNEILILINNLINQSNEDYLRELVSKLFDVCTYSPHFLKKRFNDLITVMSGVRKLDQDVNGNLKIESVECLVNMIEKYPDLIEQNQQYLTQVLDLMIQNMLEIEDEIPEEWACPPDGFNDDCIEDDDQKIIKIQMDCVDKLLTVVGNDILIPILQDYITKLLGQNNWKMTHATVMIISQIGEYLDPSDETEPYVNILEQQATHPNPRVRYAVCHALGQYADDQSPDFQDLYHERYFKMTIPLLSDKVPRVVAHCLASMTNFLENCTPQQIEPHFNTIYQGLIHHLNHGIAFVREACLSTMSALAEGAQDIFEPHYDEVFQIIFQIFANSNNPDFKQMVGSAIECASIIAKEFSIERFQPYQNKLIEELIKIQTQGVSLDGPDPQKSYLLAGWQRISTIVGKDLIPYLQQMMPSLLQMSYLPLKNNQGQKGRITDDEECEIAIQLINIFLQDYPQQMVPYINDIYQLIFLINDKIKNLETKTVALGLLPSLITTAKSANNFDQGTFSKQIFSSLWEIFVNEEDSSYKSEYCYFLQQVLENSGRIFNKEELQHFLKNMEDQLNQSEERRQKILENYDLEEETKETLDFNVKCEHNIEDDFKLEIANLFGKVFFSHKEIALDIFQHIYQNHIIPCFQNPTKINLEYGLYLIDDSLENLGEFIPADVLANFYNLLTQGIKTNQYDLRQSSIYGIGLLAKKMNIEQFKEYFQPIMQICSDLLNEPKKDKDEEHSHFNTYKDNVVSAYGKSFSAYWNHMNSEQKQYCTNQWLSHLPLTHDKSEGLEQNQLLIQLLGSQEAHYVYGNNYQNLQKILEIFQKIFYKKNLVNDEITNFIREFIKNMQNQPQLMEVYKNLNISDEMKKFLTNVFNK